MQFNGNISKVQLVFENCEFVEIDVKNIFWLHIGDEKTRCSRYANGLSVRTVIGEFGIALRNTTPSDFHNNTPLVERLDMRDVTHVRLIDVCGLEKDYVVEWSTYNTSDQHSINQRVQFTPGGNIVFLSSTGKLISVDDESIDVISTYM